MKVDLSFSLRTLSCPYATFKFYYSIIPPSELRLPVPPDTLQLQVKLCLRKQTHLHGPTSISTYQYHAISWLPRRIVLTSLCLSLYLSIYLLVLYVLSGTSLHDLSCFDGHILNNFVIDKNIKTTKDEVLISP